MRIMKNMLMIGATEKNAGKTVFTSAIIKNIKLKNPEIILYAVKITILNEGSHSVSGFKVTTESDIYSEKDTGRMFSAGSDKVLWLRCDEFSVETGIDQLVKEIPDNAMIICESNSARKHIEPGLFLMIRRKIEGSIKETARIVMKYPHIEIRSEMLDGKVCYVPDITEKIVVNNHHFKVN